MTNSIFNSNLKTELICCIKEMKPVLYGTLLNEQIQRHPKELQSVILEVEKIVNHLKHTNSVSGGTYNALRDNRINNASHFDNVANSLESNDPLTLKTLQIEIALENTDFLELTKQYIRDNESCFQEQDAIAYEISRSMGVSLNVAQCYLYLEKCKNQLKKSFRNSI